MKNWLLLCAAMCLSSCQCHREPDAPARTATETASPSAKKQPPAPETDPAYLAAQEAARAQSAAYTQAASTVHRYLAALPRGSQGDADTLWTGGRPSPVPDDANLRSVQNLRSLRVENDTPVALDRESPPRAIEVPVRLLVRTDEGNRRFTGWYRLRPRVDGSGWEITSASLQPALD